MKKPIRDPKAIDAIKEAFNNSWNLDFTGCDVYVWPEKKLITVTPSHPLYRLRQVEMQQQFVDNGANIHEVNEVLDKIEKILTEAKPEEA